MRGGGRETVAIIYALHALQGTALEVVAKHKMSCAVSFATILLQQG